MSLVFDSGLSLYRKTLKRIRPIHIALHWASTRLLIPLLQMMTGFKTMPDDPFWFRLELLINRHEKETIAQIDKLVKPGMVVLDIGAHVGYYARRCARLVGDEGRVVCFEPHPRTFKMLTNNVSRYGNVLAAQVAVADQEGTAELYDYLMMSASGSLHYDEALRDLQKAHTSDGDVAPRLARDLPVEKFTVRTTPVDNLLAEQGIERVDVIKMDIEGAEIIALRGMRKTIQNADRLHLIMEYNPQALHASGLQPEAALQEVTAMGFSLVYAIETDGTLTNFTDDAAALEKRTAALMEHMDVINLLFIRDET
jgi:FkbM family methyltransferase